MSEHEPNIWCLLGRKAGDNTQVRSLAEALGVSFTEKHIAARGWELLPHLLLRTTLLGIDRGASSELAAPWPDLVISAGRRNEPVARWIRRQSGGSTRLVHIGRAWAAPDCWDLVITTPQYFLPAQPNILHNQLPLHRQEPERLKAAAQDWQQRFAALPRPLVAVLVGGDSGKFVMTDDKGRRLGELAAGLAGRCGGSLVSAASPRTPQSAFDAMVAAADGPGLHFPWGGDNPYQALLACADAFVVTGESMSMLGEASATGKALYIFDLADADGRWWRRSYNYRYKPLSHRLAMTLAPMRFRRDVGRIQDALVHAGQAAWLTGDSEFTARAAVATDSGAELVRSAAAVRQLLPPR
jgi:mitochondrial fission protein ELM1